MLVYILLSVVFALAIAVPVLAVSNAKLWVKILAMENSTHQIQFIDPLKAEFQKPTKSDEAQMQDSDFDNIIQ